MCQMPSKMNPKKASTGPQVENVEEEEEKETDEMSVLELPELILECILERLPPSGLFNMASVSSSLRKRCVSDYLWERHMKQKWGRVIGPAAHREWKRFIAARRDCGVPKQGKQKGIMKLLNILPFSWFKSKPDNIEKQRISQCADSIMSWYLALETGKFLFPAQVYNREYGHVGFMLSCYDAQLSYDSQTDTFQARYPPHGRGEVTVESGITWDRLRGLPVDTSPHDLHVSDCFSNLQPGDHIEIQWRRNKDFPYGWWYGIVGHLDSCDGSEIHCHCIDSEKVIIEFNQYTPGSRWRHTMVDRRNHREEGNEEDGFYGGIRKLHSQAEIDTWKRLWPSQVLE